MTLETLLWFVVAVIGAFILGLLAGRYYEGRLYIDGEPVGGKHDDHH